VPLPGPRRQGPGLRTAVALGAASDQGQGAERAARVADMRRR
ncbi:DeoR family transcriptional regulator, partial [Streptomyces sp. Akac8]